MTDKTDFTLPSGLAPLRTKQEQPTPVVDRSSGSWKFLLTFTLTFAALVTLTVRAFSSVPSPLPFDAPLGLFAEGRARATTAYLADTIGNRQVSTEGAERGALYLLEQAHKIAADAAAHRPDLKVEVAREQVTGALSRQIVFGLEIANVYNNLTNVILKISPKHSNTTRSSTKPPPSVLMNAHYDSTLGSPGASDAASCVGVALEIARTIVANVSLPLAAPIVFLFNGGEETLMQASHGFMASSAFSKELGAFINLESTGAWGPDVLFQHSGDWTLRAYSRVAPYPRGTTVGQDFFELGVIPADTDYRMFSYRQYGSVPGIDVAFLFDGTAYHTNKDETKRIRAGTLQGMGENMLATVLEYCRVLGSGDFRGEGVDWSTSTTLKEERKKGHVFFDVLSSVMVVYSHRTAAILHQLPLLLLLSLSLLAGVDKVKGQPAGTMPAPGPLLRSLLSAVCAVLAAALTPAVVGGVRVVLTQRPLSWYGDPLAAYSVFAPAALAGFLAPFAWSQPTKNKTTLEHDDQVSTAVQCARVSSLGMALLFSAFSTALTVIGMHSAYLFVAWSLGALAAAYLSAAVTTATKNKNKCNNDGDEFTWRSAVAICACFSPPIIISLPTAMTVAQHIMEKIGLAGSTPGALGAAVPDAAVGALTGVGVLLAFGAAIPYVAAALGGRAKGTVAVLLALSLTSAAVSPTAAALSSWSSWNWKGASSPPPPPLNHPYSSLHPKRVIVQHVHRHSPSGHVNASFFTFCSLDAIPVEVALPPSVRSLPLAEYRNADWVALYPINYLATGTARRAPPPPPTERAPTLTLVVSVGDDGDVRGNTTLSSSLWSKLKQQFGGGGGGKNRDACSSSSSSSSCSISSGGGGGTAKDNIIDSNEETGDKRRRRWHLELETASKSAWAVMNITVASSNSSNDDGRVTGWSLGPEVASTIVKWTGGGGGGGGGGSTVCHMVRYASGSGTSRYSWWIDTVDVSALRIELFVKHLDASDAANAVVALMPEWVSPAAVTTWQSVWEFI